MPTLLIKLQGVLQSYGTATTFAYRTTNNQPTKSAIVGFLSAALGYQREDPRIAELAKLPTAIRIDQSGEILQDFHMIHQVNVQQTRNAKSWHKSSLFAKLPGGKRSWRDYLQDAIFIVAIQCNEKAAKKLDYAIHHPKFQLYLGRKANTPAGPIQTWIKNIPTKEALKTLPWQGNDWYQKRQQLSKSVKCQLVGDNSIVSGPQLENVNDFPTSFGPQKSFRYHAVSYDEITCKIESE